MGDGSCLWRVSRIVTWCDVSYYKRAIRKEPSYYVERTSGWIGFRAIYSLFRAFCHQGSICFHAIFMSPPPLAKSSLPLSWRICKWGPRDWQTQCSKVDLCSFLEHSAVVETPGTAGIIFSSATAVCGGRITFSSARGKKEEDCSLPKRLFTICPANNREKKQALACKIEFEMN